MWYYWIPKLLGLSYNIFLSKIQFWVLFIGVNWLASFQFCLILRIAIKYLFVLLRIIIVKIFFFKIKFNLFLLINNYLIAKLVEVKNLIMWKRNFIVSSSLIYAQKASQSLNIKDIQCDNLSHDLTSSCKEVCLDKKVMNNKKLLDPFYITGLADAESTFTLKISKQKNGSWGINPVFRIELHNKNSLLLKKVKYLFGVGNLRDNIRRTSTKNLTSTYSVESTKDFLNVIIPHFDKYPLLTQKAADFILLKQIVEKINRKEHLSSKVLAQIINIRAAINYGLSSNLQKSFSNVIPVERPFIKETKTFNPNWLVGFIDGEGCFEIKISKSTTHKTGKQIQLRFTLTQTIRDILLMKNIQKYFACGKMSYNSAIRFVIRSFIDIEKVLIPFFEKYPLQSSKRLDYIDFLLGFDLMKNKAHLTSEGVEKLLLIKSGMNKGRKIP